MMDAKLPTWHDGCLHPHSVVGVTNIRNISLIAKVVHHSSFVFCVLVELSYLQTNETTESASFVNSFIVIDCLWIQSGHLCFILH